MPGWMNYKLESRHWGQYQRPQISRWYHSNGRKWRGTKEPFDEGKRGEWKSWLKTQHSKTKIMAFSPNTAWQIEAEKVESVTDFLSLGSKISAEWYYSHEIKRCLLLGRKNMTNLDSVLKSKDITWLANIHIVKAVFFPVLRYRCESWIIRLRAEELMLLSCVAGEASWEFLGLWKDQTSQC